jgi:hypothetical protein
LGTYPPVPNGTFGRGSVGRLASWRAFKPTVVGPMNDKFIVYVIQNETGKTYTGFTSDLAKRLSRHNGSLKNKITSFTSKNKKGEWKVV